MLCYSLQLEMFATIMSDAMIMPTTSMMIQTTEVEFAKCDCCGLTEECTPAYIERIRERYNGKWICGLCGEAVKYEVMRSEGTISTDEAMSRHMIFCRKSTSSDPPPNPAVHLITAMRQILRRSLESPRSLRSVPSSPLKSAGGSVRLSRSASCITDLALESSSYTELQDTGK
ncbi:hypothetical protein LXL04_032226 [Taraxacum kok-saghyz]